MAQLTQTVDRYISAGWMPTMIEIWREKVARLKIIRTGSFYQSFAARLTAAGEGRTITMKFLRYGLYQMHGTGRGYESGNSGDLPFLDPDYRREHGLDKPRKVGPAWGGYMTSGNPRKRRDWMSRKLYMSVMALKEDLARITGEEAAAVICEALEDPRDAL